MRKLIFTLLLAGTAAAPALAQDSGPFGLRRDRAAQSQASDDGERQRPARAERQRESSEPAREQRVLERRERRERAVQAQEVARPETTAPVEARRGQRFERQADTAAPVETRRVRRGGSFADRVVDMRRARNGDAVVVNRDTTAPTRTETRHSRSDRQWSGQWRNDRRYDWRRHRDRNRSAFRFGNYYDPYGYGYRRFSIGLNLGRSYYNSNHWLNDPWSYRLPPAYGPYRWVRYWDDALLVNVYTGRVVDVVHDFFW